MIVVDASALLEFLLQTPLGTRVETRLGRAWELRDNVTAHDAMYIALAEAIDAPLITCDAHLGAAPGHASQVEVIG